MNNTKTQLSDTLNRIESAIGTLKVMNSKGMDVFQVLLESRDEIIRLNEQLICEQLQGELRIEKLNVVIGEQTIDFED